MPEIATLLSSVWLYPAIFGAAVVDAFAFLAPSELLVLAAATTGVTEGLRLVRIVLAAAFGAVIGDHLSYQLGRTGGRRFRRRGQDTEPRRGAVFEAARRALLRRGGVILIGARYVPGGRTAVTLAAGAVGYSRVKFLLFDVVAALMWATFYCVLGHLGGATFGDNLWVGLAAGLGFAAVAAVLGRLARIVIERRGRSRVAGG